MVNLPNNADTPVRADHLKAGERFHVAGIEYQIVSVTRDTSDRPRMIVYIYAVRPDGTSGLNLELLDGDWLTLTHKIPDEW